MSQEEIMPSVSHAIRPGFPIAVVLIAFIVATYGFAAGAALTRSDEAGFLAENDKAMAKMMHDMSIKPSGNVDEDFVEMMVPHHQGAIDMAQSELRYGHNEQLRRIAQEIVVEQQQEIVAMRLGLGQPYPPQRRRQTSSPPSNLATTPADSAPNHSTLNLNKEPK
jgi:hypothetical protein